VLEKILVPLDGSELSDRIITQLKRLLVRADARVELVRVLPEEKARDPKSGAALVDVARDHLEKIAAPLEAGGAQVTCEVLVGEPAERILAFARESKPSVVALATHGRSGIARWIRGSTAERILRASSVPLFLANPHGLGEPAELRMRKILVPLDGSQRSAQILPLVREIARLYESQVTLFYAIELLTAGEPMLAAAVMTTAEAHALLEPFRRRLEVPDAQIKSALGNAAVSILDEAERGKYDLIAIGTHGRTGLDRWAFGSVAEHVVRHAPCPLFVQRTVGVPEKQA
jgi:nucleotide-binding universal stress UspA family protein